MSIGWAIGFFVAGTVLYLIGKFIAEETQSFNAGKTIGFTGLALIAIPVVLMFMEAPR
jgi:hypothetical protein